MIDFRLPSPTEIENAQADAMTATGRLVDAVVAASERTFANTLQPLEEAADLIEHATGRFGFMSYVAEDDAVRAAADDLREALEKYEIELGYREDLHQAVKEYAASSEAASLSGED